MNIDKYAEIKKLFLTSPSKIKKNKKLLNKL